jgi:hypothetical protein
MHASRCGHPTLCSRPQAAAPTPPPGCPVAKTAFRTRIAWWENLLFGSRLSPLCHVAETSVAETSVAEDLRCMGRSGRMAHEAHGRVWSPGQCCRTALPVCTALPDIRMCCPHFLPRRNEPWNPHGRNLPKHCPPRVGVLPRPPNRPGTWSMRRLELGLIRHEFSPPDHGIPWHAISGARARAVFTSLPKRLGSIQKRQCLTPAHKY